MLPPAAAVAGPDFVMLTSASALTVVEADEVLFAGTGSGVVAVTVAVFEIEPACAGAVTVTVMSGADVPDARAGRVQVTETFPALVQVQPVPEAEPKVTPLGRVSTTVLSLIHISEPTRQ